MGMLGVLRRGSSGPNAQGMQLQQRCVEAARACWMANGDHIAHIYTGTGALGGGRSKLKDAALTTKRALQNTWLGTHTHTHTHRLAVCTYPYCSNCTPYTEYFRSCTLVAYAQYIKYSALLPLFVQIYMIYS